MEEELGPVSAQTLRDSVADVLRRAIVDGQRSPNARLNEARIAGQLGVSRAPVREALSQLEEEGLVRSEPNKGTFVTELSWQDIEEILSLREVLECFALRRAGDRLTDDDLAHLESILADLSAAALADDRAQFLEKDLELHRQICMASGHGLLVKLWTRLAAQTRRYMMLNLRALDEVWGGLSIGVEGHIAIVKALRNRDLEAAEQALRLHLTESAETMVQAAKRDRTDPEARG